MNFAQNLKKLRISANLTQTELADALNTSRQNITNWEIAKIIPDIRTIDAIAQYFSVSLH